MKKLTFLAAAFVAALVISCDAVKDTSVTIPFKSNIDLDVAATVGSTQATASKAGAGDYLFEGSATLVGSEILSAYSEYSSFQEFAVKKVSLAGSSAGTGKYVRNVEIKAFVGTGTTPFATFSYPEQFTLSTGSAISNPADLAAFASSVIMKMLTSEFITLKAKGYTNLEPDTKLDIKLTISQASIKVAPFK